MNIVLTGFMASGKTTAAKLIAEISDYEFIDTDDMIVEAEGRAISEIFAEDGEEYFRRVEYETVCRAAAMDRKVISTGGGVVLNRANIDKLRENGVIFNLSPDFSVIKNRISLAAKTRPLLQNQSISDVKKRFDERRPFYDDCDHRIYITATTSEKETVDKIMKIAKQRYGM